MKYLRSYLLVPGAGGQILGSRSSGYRPLRRLTTTHRHSKVTNSNCKYRCLPGKRQVSTDGAKKSQLAVVGQVAPALPPPRDNEIDFVSVERQGAKTCPGRDAMYGLDQARQRHGNPSYFAVGPKKPPETPSYGQFLSEANSLKPSLDPLSMEMAFLPTFHAFRNDIGGLFFANRPKSAGVPSNTNLAANLANSEAPDITDTELELTERSKSLEALLPTESPNLVDDVTPEVPIRQVKREIVLPRTAQHEAQNLCQVGSDRFLEVHNFQKKGPDSETGEKSEDICPFPKCEDSANPHPGSLIIQSDRSSLIIHRDLYITNRILEKLKKMEEKNEITPEPTVKTMALDQEPCSQGIGDQAVEWATSSTGLDAPASLCSSPFVPDPHSHEADSETSLEAIRSFAPFPAAAAKPLTNTSLVPRGTHDESYSHLTNVEFKMAGDRMSAVESMALQARKNLYARMKNASSPCILVDGVDVKHAKLEDVIPAVGTPVKADADQNGISGQNEAVREDLREWPVSLETGAQVGSDPSPLFETPLIQLRSSEVAPSENLSTTGTTSYSPESYQPLGDTLQQETDFDSHFQAMLVLGQPMSPSFESDLRTLGEHDSDKLQSEIEDWFIPLGKEIESMLLTLEASNHERPRNLEETFNIEEEISNVRDFENNIPNEPDSHPFEGVEIIENALLSPRGQPFSSGQSRDKNTISGSMPPKSKNPNVDIKTETTIKCSRSGDNTDINVTETQRYLDKRLPYPFCTETVLQVYGTSESLSKATQAVETSKTQLVHLSNANSPNPGMLTPKLQFNHMLSKSHENFKSNNKKTVLKIKVVPNSGASHVQSSNPSSEPKPQPSHVLQLTEQPETSTDVSKLIRRSKFNHKTGPKNLRRGDSLLKLRQKKKFNKDSSENIKILSPKDLEKMFPSPPKPKPVEKPRKVTVETKMGKESSVVNTVKTVGSQGGFLAAQFKSRKVQEDIIKKPDVPRAQNDSKVNSHAENEAAKVMAMSQAAQPESAGALSARDQKILQTLISHKVKDSFMAVTKAQTELANPKPESSRSSEPRTIIGVADKIESSVSVKPRTVVRPKSPISQTVDRFSSAEIKYDVNKTNQGYQNDPKTVYATILETAKEKPKEKVPPKVPRPKSPRPESPTPKPNREYITIKTEPTPKAAAEATPEKARTVEKKTEKGESVLPVSASTMIANVMKSSGDLAQSESRWRNLDQKAVLNQTANNYFPREKNEMKPADIDRAVSSKPNVEKTLDKLKPDGSAGKKAEPVTKEDGDKHVVEMDEKFIEAFKEKKVWNLPSEPLFFPFETPNFKEVLEEPPVKSQSTQPFPNEPSAPKASSEPVTYEKDFCKLCTENTPGLAATVPVRYKVPLDRMKIFPLLNPGKPKAYSVPTEGAVSISPVHDLMLMRNLREVPAVTKVLGATLSAKSQQALDRWKQGLISTLGEQGFQEFYQNQLKRGTEFHSTVKKFLVDHLDCKDDLCMKSLSGVLRSVSDVSVIESQVVHPLLGYRGVIDCVAKYKGKPVVIEWKRSDKAKPTVKHTYDAPLQLSAYFGAMNFDSNYKAQHVEGGVVVVAYSDGSPADVFELSVEECERYWAKWLKRLHQFYTKIGSPSA